MKEWNIVPAGRRESGDFGMAHAGRRGLIFRAVFWLFSAAAAARILMLPSGQCSHTLLISLLPVLAACLILGKSHLCLRRRGGVMLCAAALTVLFLLMLSVREIVARGSLAGWHGVLYTLFLSAAAFIVMGFCLERFLDRRESGRMAGLPPRRLFVFYGLLAVAFLMANFPFRPSADALTVYNTIESEAWSDWHPIGYVAFVDLCMSLVSPILRHPFSVCVVQTVFWLLLVRRICGIFRQCFDSETPARVFLAVNSVVFVPLLYLGVMYKDVLFSLCLLGLSAELFFLLHTGEGKRRGMVLLALFAAGMGIFRHMGIVTALFCLTAPAVWLLLRKNKAWRGLLCCACFAAAVYGAVVWGYGNGILHMEKNPSYIKYTVPLYITGNLAAEHPELFGPEEREIAEKLMPLEEWASLYEMDPYFADNLSRGGGILGERVERVDDAYGREILKLNFTMLRKDPGAWISALLKITSIVWQIGRPADGYEWTVAGYYRPEDQPAFVAMHMITQDTALAWMLGELEYGLEDQPFLSFLYYRGGIWAFSLVFAAAVFWLKKRGEMLFAVLPAAVNTAFLMLSCPSQDPRFVLPALETGLFLLPAAYFLMRKGEEKHVYQ